MRKFKGGSLVLLPILIAFIVFFKTDGLVAACAVSTIVAIIVGISCFGMKIILTEKKTEGGRNEG